LDREIFIYDDLIATQSDGARNGEIDGVTTVGVGDGLPQRSGTAVVEVGDGKSSRPGGEAEQG
jgi:hypothetical protein